jgi:hypothetical protein
MEINDLISLANEKLGCGPECEKDKQMKELRNIFDKSKQTLIDAPSEYVKAEKNYLIYSKGENEYKNIMKERTIKTINDMKKKLLEKHKLFINDIRGFLNQYNTDYVYSNRIDDFYKSLLKDNNKYKKDISDYTSQTNVNNRKVFYEDEDMVNMSYIRIILLFIYFITLIAILYKIGFINKELYKNIYVWLSIIVYILFGIFINWVTAFLYYVKLYITRFFENDVPRNVYIDM